MICHYSLQVVGSPPSGQVASFKNDLFIAFDNGQSTQTATESVKPFAESTGTKSTTTTSTTTSTSEKTTEQSNQSTSTSGASGAVLGLSTSSSGSAAGVAGAVAGVQAVQTPNTGAQPAVLGGLLLTGLGLLLIGASQRRRRGPG